MYICLTLFHLVLAFEILHTNVICGNSRDEHLLSNIISSKSQSAVCYSSATECANAKSDRIRIILGVDRKRLKHHFGARYTCVHMKYLQVVQSAHMFVIQTQIYTLGRKMLRVQAF